MKRKAGNFAVACLAGCLICTGVAGGATGDAEIGSVERFRIGPSETGGAVALCPAGTRALSGGIIQTRAATEAYLRESGPISDLEDEHSADTGEIPIGWVATVSASDPVTFEVFVVCARARVTMAVESFEGAFSREFRNDVECPGTKRAVGGGVLQQGNPGSDYVTESGPLVGGEGYGGVKSGEVPTAWRATVAAEESGDEIKVAAICAKESGATMKVTTESLPDFGPSDGVARCNGAPRALGGGVIHKGATNPFILVSATGPLAESQIVTATDPGDVAEYWYAATYFVDDGIPYKTVAICE